MDFHIEVAVEYILNARVETFPGMISTDLLADLGGIGVTVEVTVQNRNAVLRFSSTDSNKFMKALNRCWDEGIAQIKVVREWF